METKVKEEVPDKDYQPTTTERRKSTTATKERPSPEQEEARAPTPGPPSPQNNGTALSCESLSPVEGRAPALLRLRRFLSALHQFATDASPDQGDRVRQLIYNLVAGTATIEEFQSGVQECTNYPLRASVPGFLRALLPAAQRDVLARARRAKQTPQQYIRGHEHLVLEAGDELFPPGDAAKRRASDPFYEAQTNGTHDDFPPPKRAPPASLFLHPSPFLYPTPSAGLFDYAQSYHAFHGPAEPGFERRDGGISVRDVSSMTASFPERAPHGSASLKCDDEWKNINTMLNCILSMVEKTKRALAILQQRGIEPSESSDIKRAASEIMAAAVRQTEERVAEVRRRAEDAVNQVKRAALVELQRAVSAAEGRALELAERKRSPPPPRDLSPSASQHQNCCWNCGRKAQETCSGCNAARYCSAFCQHKDWENHHQVCSGREQKPGAALRTSPSAKPPRATPPSAPLPLTSDRLLTQPDRIIPQTDRILPQADRILPQTERILPQPDRILPQNERILPQSDRILPQSDRILPQTDRLPQDRPITERLDRNLNSERITLANLSSAQGILGIGKK